MEAEGVLKGEGEDEAGSEDELGALAGKVVGGPPGHAVAVGGDEDLAEAGGADGDSVWGYVGRYFGGRVAEEGAERGNGPEDSRVPNRPVAGSCGESRSLDRRDGSPAIGSVGARVEAGDGNGFDVRSRTVGLERQEIRQETYGRVGPNDPQKRGFWTSSAPESPDAGTATEENAPDIALEEDDGRSVGLPRPRQHQAGPVRATSVKADDAHCRLFFRLKHQTPRTDGEKREGGGATPLIHSVSEINRAGTTGGLASPASRAGRPRQSTGRGARGHPAWPGISPGRLRGATLPRPGLSRWRPVS